MKFNFKGIIMLVLIVAVMITAVSIFSMPAAGGDVFTYSDLIELFEADRVISFNVNGNSVITVNYCDLDENKNPVLDESGKVITKSESYAFTDTFQLERLDKIISEGELKNLEEYNFERPAEAPWYQIYLPYIIVGVLLIVMMIFVIRSAGAGGGKLNSFSKSHAKVSSGDKDAVKFADVAGADEEKAELEEVVEFIRIPINSLSSVREFLAVCYL